jgi:hypothetical protein
MDLNELPPKFDYDFLNDPDENPSYCTQAFEASGQGQVHHIVHVSDQRALPALGDVEAAIGNYNIAENLEDVQNIADNTQGIADVEENWSTPPVPYSGQAFSGKQEAREFYNSYANGLVSQFVRALHACQV